MTVITTKTRPLGRMHPAIRRVLGAVADRIGAARQRALLRNYLRDMRARDLEDVGLLPPNVSSLTPSFDAADALARRANGGRGFHR